MGKVLLYWILFFRKLKVILLKPYWQSATKMQFLAFSVDFKSFNTNGVPHLFVKNGHFRIGHLFRMNNGFTANIIGRQQRCIFIVNGGELEIGDNVGLSSTAIVCHKKVKIGNNVRIGGNTVLYDTDFHSLDKNERVAIPEKKENIKTKPITIGNNVFVGGHSTILKGSNIGKNVIIGAGSVITGTIPDNEIWAGNPAKFIRKNRNAEI